MTEKMTLADFARSIGVTPDTARQWKRRSKIVERDGGYALDASVTSKTVTHPVVGVTDCASCESLAALATRLDACERDNAALQRFVDGLRDRVTALESAQPPATSSSLKRGSTIRANERTEIVDGDYLDSQRWSNS